MYNPVLYGATTASQPLQLDIDSAHWNEVHLSGDDPMLLELIRIVVANKYAAGELRRYGNLYCTHGQYGLDIHVDGNVPQGVWEALFLAMYRSGAATILMRKTADGDLLYEWGYPTGEIIHLHDTDIMQVNAFVSWPALD